MINAFWHNKHRKVQLMKKNTVINDLSSFITASPSPFQAVAEGIRRLEGAGFRSYTPGDAVSYGDKLYFSASGVSLFAFNIGDKPAGKKGLKINLAGAHIDSPCIHIKPNPEMKNKGYLRLNADVYGGPIVNTWLDRPLSIAGCVAVKDKAGKVSLELFDAKAPVVTIPNLAIHMNREVNKGVELNRQTDILPLIGLSDEKAQGEFTAYLAKQLKVATGDIVDFDLYIYNFEQPCLVGIDNEFFSAPRLDDLTSAHALLAGIAEKPAKGTLNVAAFFNNEEVGSLSANGADSRILPMLLESIYEALGRSRSSLNADILGGTLLSLDVAHALHPNMTGKYDPTNFALMGDGVVFKLNSNQKYINDLSVLAKLEVLCEKNGIPYKRFVNRSDVAGGGTIGNVLASWLPMPGLDLGLPILAMHSARETMGTNDQEALIKLLIAFFTK